MTAETGPRATSDADAVRAALLTGPLSDHRDPAEVLASDVVYRGMVWDIRSDRFRFDGAEITREYVDHPGAVAVLAMDDDGRVLLINQYRHPVRTRDWELPAGLRDVDGEDPMATAQRELAEEVDLTASRWSELVAFATSPGGSDEHLTVYLAQGLAPTGEAFGRSAEEAQIVPRWVHLDEAVDAVLAGRLTNAILIIAVLAAHARRRA